MSAPRFSIDRVLAAGDVEALVADARLAALLRGRGGRPLQLTVWAPVERSRDAVSDALVARFGAAFGIVDRLDVRGPSTPIESLLDGHDALVPVTGPDSKRLIIAGWQRGLAVMNSVEQAERLAAFEDDYVDPEGAAAGRRRWYSIMEGSPVIVTSPERICLEYGARINPRAVIHNEGSITIGRGSLLGADAELNLYTATFTMGRFCHTSSYFCAVGSRHTLSFPSTFSVSRGPYAFLGEAADVVGDIVIGNDVWFGAHVIVMPGVHVADGCVVGGGSVVTSPLTDPYGIYAGNPARLIRHRFPPHVVKWLTAIEWWNWPTAKLWALRDFFSTDISGKTEAELWRLVDATACERPSSS